MKAVIYARYSSDNQTEASIEGQLRECRAFAEKNDITIIGEYIDRAFSAKTDNRPEFQRMIKDSYKKVFDAVLVWKLDRFARNRYDSAVYKAVLSKNGARVLSATERISEGAEGIILEGVLESVAEYYSVELAEKINRGLMENAFKGKLNGGSIPMGYKLTKEKSLEVDKELAPIVLEVFTRYADGELMNDIAKDLALRGVKTSRGNAMSLNVVHTMLKNRKYLGEYKFRDIVIPNAFEAIIPEELFERVQTIMRKNTKAPASHKAENDYILTGKLKCGKCGALMVGESGTGRNKIVHRYYKCANTKKRKLCDKKPVKKEWIEDVIIKYTMEIVWDDELIGVISDAIVELLGEENVKIPQLEGRLKELNGYISNVMDAIMKGLFNEAAKQRLDELEASKAETEKALASEKLERPPITKDMIEYYIKRFRTVDLDELESRKRLINTFVNTVFLYDDKLVIIFNYKDGTKELTLDEINAKIGSDLESQTPPKTLIRYIVH